MTLEEIGLVLPCRTKEEWIYRKHIKINQSIYHIEVEKVNNKYHKIKYIILLYILKQQLK